MKMQEVITKLRKDVPVLAKHAQDADAAFKKLCGLYEDLRRSGSESGRALLQEACNGAMGEFSGSFSYMMACVERLEKLNGEYTRKLGPRETKPKDDPRQMELALEPSPASQADSANAAIAGGRHG